VVEAAAAAVWAPVEEAQPWSGAHRHGGQEAQSLRAPLVEEPEKVVPVEAPDDTGTPARAQCSVQVMMGPRVVQEEAPKPRVTRRGAPGASGPLVVRRGAPGPRVAQPKAPSPRQVRRMAPEPRVVQEEALAPP
jgi:hypothetical protein